MVGVREAFDALFQHGGDINSARTAFPDAPAPWVDLSTGVNPVPYPVAGLDLGAWTQLPGPAETWALQVAAAARYGAAPERIVVAPGAQAIIQWLPRLFPARRVAILGPTYSGHELAWRAAGVEVEEVRSPDELGAASHIVVVNPNNPDGRRLPPQALHALAAQAERNDGLLVVDEAFADFDRESLAPDPPAATVVLRSFGKTYGLAGLRLGFAITNRAICEPLRAALGAWAVSGPALEIGRRALADSEWLADARARLEDDAAWLDRRLVAAGFEIVGGTLLFRLAGRADAGAAFPALGAEGVLTRPFRRNPRLLRFGLPRPEDRSRVEAALKGLRDRPQASSAS